MYNIMMICGAGDQSNYVYNNVSKEFEISKVFIVGDGSRKTFLKRRIRKLGIFKVIGQIMFVLYTKLYLRKRSEKRIEDIQREHDLDSTEIPQGKIEHIDSVNGVRMEQALKEIGPDLVIINGTPIIKSHILDAVDAPFLNIHVGITPKYRGVHGGYWALYNGDGDLAGVTTHFVDAGIDTGTVLDQNTIEVTGDDNFLTYTHLQAAAAFRNYNAIVREVLEGDAKFVPPLTDESAIWSHPALWEYVYGRVFRKVK